MIIIRKTDYGSHVLIRNREMNKDYLSETKTINYGDPVIQEKVSELKADTVTAIDYIVKAYEFVRMRSRIHGISDQPLSPVKQVMCWRTGQVSVGPNLVFWPPC